MKLSIPKVVKLQESCSVQLFYADKHDKNRFGACNLCMQFGLSRLRCKNDGSIGLKLRLLMVEIKGILILWIIKNTGNQENTEIN